MAFKITSKEIWAIVLAIAPFVLRFGSRATVNGVVQYDYNYVGIVAGALAIAVAGYAAMKLKADIGDQPPMPHYLLLGAAALLGLYQLLNGASII
jgi:predicted lysophospholipase L1 biosynthesis ABC-type transport system permease subunit